MILLRYRHSQKSLVRNCEHYLETMMSDETTTEQLAEIEGQAADIPATEYTLPEGWQEVPLGEPLKGSDEYHAGLDRYIRRTESQPEPQPQPEPVQVREGRWRTRDGNIRNVTPTPDNGREHSYPWWDAAYGGTWTLGGRYYFSKESPWDLVEYLGPLEQQPETQQNGLVRDVTHLLQDSGVLDSAKAEQQIEELRSEVSYVQRLLGTERRRVAELEELVGSLRTINEGAEKAVSGAGVVNDSLRLQLAAVKAELVTQAETSRRLQIELDAAQQVPADSPELRQLRADLAEVAHDRDTYKHAHELLVRDIDATHQRTKAMTVEAIAEWLVPVQAAIAAADNVAESTRAGCLAEAVIQHLPSIMRGLTGLVDEEPDPQLAPY